MTIKQIPLVTCLLVTSFSLAQKDIFDVARNGTINDVIALMEINVDTINVVNKEGYVPLTVSCYRGNTEVALFLASKVKDIDGNSNYGTPLMAAVYKNKPVIVERLLELNANPNIADGNGTTPLHYAIIFRNEKIIKLLLSAKADVDFKDKRGNSAKDYAAMTNNESIIELINKI